jgi:hypothetical protein
VALSFCRKGLSESVAPLPHAPSDGPGVASQGTSSVAGNNFNKVIKVHMCSARCDQSDIVNDHWVVFIPKKLTIRCIVCIKVCDSKMVTTVKSVGCNRCRIFVVERSLDLSQGNVQKLEVPSYPPS